MARIIAIDGIDGVGKSTQCRCLAQRLGQNGFGVEIASLRKESSFNRRLSRSPKMRPEAELILFLGIWERFISGQLRRASARVNGGYVVCDRWVTSLWAYQGARCPVAAAKAFLKLSSLEPRPGLVIVLDGVSWRRVRLQNSPVNGLLESLQAPARQMAARQAFLSLLLSPTIELVNAQREPLIVAEDIWRRVVGRYLGKAAP